MAALVELCNLTIAFGTAPPVLADFSIALEDGSFTCLVGTSGVGKSTLLRLIARLETPRSGTIVGPEPSEPGRRPSAMVFREPRLLPWRPVIDNVMFGLEGLGLPHEQRLLRAQAALAAVSMADQAGRWPRQLSAADAQRVNLARALAVRPRLLLLDHPFSGLDAASRWRLQGDLQKHLANARMTTLLVTRDIDEAVFLADRVIVLGGRPARMIRDFPVTLPRPRQPEAGSFAAQVRSVRDLLSNLVTDGEGI